LGENVGVSRVTIFNRNDGDITHSAIVTSRLSNSKVSLLDQLGNTLKSYRIGDATNISLFNISFEGNNGILIG
jgi:hypothetical protein